MQVKLNVFRSFVSSLLHSVSSDDLIQSYFSIWHISCQNNSDIHSESFVNIKTLPSDRIHMSYGPIT